MRRANPSSLAIILYRMPLEPHSLEAHGRREWQLSLIRFAQIREEEVVWVKSSKDDRFLLRCDNMRQSFL